MWPDTVTDVDLAFDTVVSVSVSYKYVLTAGHGIGQATFSTRIPSTFDMLSFLLLLLLSNIDVSEAVFPAGRRAAQPGLNGSLAAQFDARFPGILVARDSCAAGPQCSGKFAVYQKTQSKLTKGDRPTRWPLLLRRIAVLWAAALHTRRREYIVYVDIYDGLTS